MGLLLAMVGFSYAIATTTDGGTRAGFGVGGRALGTTGLSGVALQFTNVPILNDGSRDLGDVSAGSSFVRYARAKGGVPPYRFTSSSVAGFSQAFSSAFPTANSFTPEILLSGKILGSSISAFALGAVKFQITVADSSGGTNATTKTDNFTITVVSANVFRFAVSALPTGVRFRPYLGIADVVGGNPDARVFSATIKSAVVPTGTTIGANAKLSVIGLEISTTDGTVFGKPTVPGTFVINVVCQDKDTGKFYAGRNGTGTSQDMGLIIDDNTIVSGDTMATKITIKGNTSLTQKKPTDSISYSGLSNLNGIPLSLLSGSVIDLRIGRYRSPTRVVAGVNEFALNDKGKTGKASDKNAVPTLKASVAKTGKTKITIAKETFGTVFDPANLVDKGTVTLPVSLVVGDAISGTEVLVFSVKSKNGKYTLTYSQGKSANVAGGFMITKISGKDGKDTPTDSWKIAFVAVPFTAGSVTTPAANFGGPNKSDKATVSIGRGFTNSIAVIESDKGVVKQNNKRKAKDPVEQVLAIGMKAKTGKSSLTTNGISAASTAIPTAQTAIPVGNTISSRLSLAVELTKDNVRLFAGEGALAIFVKKAGGKTWTSANPVK